MKTSEEADESDIPQSFHRSFNMSGLTTFPSFKILLPFHTLTFVSNPIDSFETLPSLPNLKHLDISETEISSYQYIQPQPLLESINIKNTPLFHYNEYILMTVIAFGSALKTINGSQISQTTYKRGLKMRPYLLSYLYNGWILLSDDPIKIFNVHTRKRLYFLSLNKIPPIAMEKNTTERKNISKSHSNFSSSSNRYKNATQRESNSNCSNKIKKKATNIRHDIISQSMPRIPTCLISRNRTTKIEKEEQTASKNKTIKSAQNTPKRLQLSHKRNKSFDSKINEDTKVTPNFNDSPCFIQKSSSTITNTQNSSEDECNFQMIPIHIKKKKKSQPTQNSLNTLVCDSSILINKDEKIEKDKMVNKTDNKELQVIYNQQDTTKNYSSQKLTNSQEPPDSLNKQVVKSSVKSLINQQKRNIEKNNRESSLNSSNKSHILKNNSIKDIDSKCNTPKRIPLQLKTPKASKHKIIPKSENINKMQTDYCNKTQINEPNSFSSMDDINISEELLDTKPTQRTPKLFTQKLDHSNALKNLSSMKDVYKDLILNIHNSDISETSEYLSDREFDKQLEIFDCALPSDSTAMDDDSFL